MKFLVLILGLIIMGSTPHAGPISFGPFPEVMDYEAFKNLPREEQREYVSLMMQAMVDFEEGWIQISKLPPTPANEALKKTTWERWQSLQRAMQVVFGNLLLSDAHARARTVVRRNNITLASSGQSQCVIGGWYSTYVNDPHHTPAHYCQRPSNSIDSTIKARYDAIQRQCPAGRMACNPAVFGTKSLDGRGQPFCVQIDVINDHNASLACLMEFENLATPSKNDRLDAMVGRILSNGADADQFNQTAQMITNTCICGVDGDNNPMNPGYVSYMQNHRTCYALMGLMRYYVQKIQPHLREGGACRLMVNASNAEALANDLASLENYTNRVSILGQELGTQNYVQTLARYRSKYATDTETARANANRVLSGNNTVIRNKANNLDFDETIDTALGQTAAARAANDGQGRRPNWCPIRVALNIVPPGTAPSCSVESLTATVGSNVTAGLSPAPAEGARVVWKLNNGDDIVASALSAPLPQGLAAGGQVSVTATVTPSTGAAYSCSAQAQVAPARNLTATNGGDTGIITVTANTCPAGRTCTAACPSGDCPAACPAGRTCTAACPTGDCPVVPPPPVAPGPVLTGASCTFDVTVSPGPDATHLKLNSPGPTLSPQDLTASGFQWSFTPPAPTAARTVPGGNTAPVNGQAAPPPPPSATPVAASTIQNRALTDWVVPIPAGMSLTEAKALVTLTLTNCRDNSTCPPCTPRTVTPPPAADGGDADEETVTCDINVQDNRDRTFYIAWSSESVNPRDVDKYKWDAPVAEDQSEVQNPTTALPAGENELKVHFKMKPGKGKNKVCSTTYTAAAAPVTPVVAPQLTPPTRAGRVGGPNGARLIEGLR